MIELVRRQKYDHRNEHSNDNRGEYTGHHEQQRQQQQQRHHGIVDPYLSVPVIITIIPISRSIIIALIDTNAKMQDHDPHDDDDADVPKHVTWGFGKLGYLIWGGPYNKDPTI